jgi:cytoskeletal protein RodZ
MSVKKASDLANLMLNPEDTTQDVKRTTGDLANDLDLFSDIEPVPSKPAATPSVKSASLASAISAAVNDAVKSVNAETNAVASPAANIAAAEAAKTGAVPASDGLHDILPEPSADNIIHYTADDKKRLLRDLGAEVEFEIPQDGKETIIKTGPKRFEDSASSSYGDKGRWEKPEKEEAPPKPPKPKYKRRKKYRDAEEKRNFISTIVIIVIVLIGIYGGLVFYVHTVNNMAYTEIIEQIDTKNLSQTLDINVSDPNVLATEKETYGLSPFLIDSDSDGLTDHFELDRGFAPALADTDGDGMPDGAEYQAGTDPRTPMTDGVTNDSAREYTNTLTQGEASVSLTGNWLIYESIFETYPISFQSRPGIISGVYELVLPGGIVSANVSFDLSKMDTDRWGEGTVPSIYSYNPETGAFEKKTSSQSGNTISAALGSGVYFVAADDIITAEAGLNIMFVIDNSGSMYSASLVDGSEENDLEFRRVDFAEDLIETMGEEANFGVSTFTMTYKLKTGISEDDSAATTALETIRTAEENWNGTEISQSIIKAVNEFDDYPADRNFIILITDGLPSDYNRDNELRAIETCKEHNVSLITIGLGKKIDSLFLAEAAEQTGGVYYQAVNNTGFESITEKISEFLLTDRNTVAPAMPDNSGEESMTSVDVIMLADSGFSPAEDRLTFGDVVTTDDYSGSDLGLALINKYYYAGTLPLRGYSYYANDRSEVRGYNLSADAFFTDGKSNLSEYQIPSTAAYQKYANVADKWAIDNISDGLLPLSDNAAKFITEPFFTKVRMPYAYDGSSTAPPILQTITFMHNKPFSEYEAAVIDTSVLTSPEKDIYDAINYYNNYSQKSGVYMYSFGVNGSTAFASLQEELTLGKPSVIAVDGRVLNVAKLSRTRIDGRSFILECYDPASSSQAPIYVYLTATKLLDGTGGFQYTASLSKSGGIVQMYLIVGGDEK